MTDPKEAKRMRPTRKLMMLFGLIVLIMVPLSVLITYVMLPLWVWFEAATGIESVDPSGPATWCFVVVFLFQCGLGLVAVLRESRGGASVSTGQHGAGSR